MKMGLCEVFEAESDYSRYERLEKLIVSCGGTVESTDFSAHVRIVFRIHADKSEIMHKRLADMSYGELIAVKVGEKYDICV